MVTEKNADIVNSLHLLETNREIKPNKVDDIVNPTGRKIVIVKEVPISDVADIETFITDPSNDYYEVKRTIT